MMQQCCHSGKPCFSYVHSIQPTFIVPDTCETGQMQTQKVKLNFQVRGILSFHLSQYNSPGNSLAKENNLGL